jgi:hypothetical protein
VGWTLRLLWLFLILASLQPAAVRYLLEARRRPTSRAFEEAGRNRDHAHPSPGDDVVLRLPVVRYRRGAGQQTMGLQLTPEKATRVWVFPGLYTTGGTRLEPRDLRLDRPAL